MKKLLINLMLVALLLPAGLLDRAAYGKSLKEKNVTLIGQIRNARFIRMAQLKMSEKNNIVSNSLKSLSKTADASSISGKLSHLDEDGIQSAYITAIDTSGAMDSAFVNVYGAVPNTDGTYTIENVPPGDYIVSTWASGYVFLFYDNVALFQDATVVKVAENLSVQDIDFTMQKFEEGKGSISGNVKDESDDSPISDAFVYVISPDNPQLFGQSMVDENGNYHIKGLKSAKYYVFASAAEYRDEIYYNAMNLDDAVAVDVVEPNETSGIDFRLDKGGIISGKIVGKDGNPLKDVFVEAWDKADAAAIKDSISMLMGGYFGYAVSDENGMYEISGLNDGNFLVASSVYDSWSCHMKWYDNVDHVEDAASITVKKGQPVTDVDFQMNFVKVEGVISGVISDKNNEPLSNAYVQVQSIEESWVWEYCITDEQGKYRFERLPAGKYLISVGVQNGNEYVYRWYDDADNIKDATAVIIDDENDNVIIDMKMSFTLPEGVIAGKVVDDNGKAILNAAIQLSPASIEDTCFVQCVWAKTQSDSSGNYKLEHLPAGEYYLSAMAWSAESFAEQWYENADNPKDATKIILSDNETRNDINFTLELKSVMGSISGTVTDSISGQPIARAYIEVSPAMDYYGMHYSAFYAVTDADGHFNIDNIYKGNYIVTVYADGAYEYYTNTKKPFKAAVVDVAAEKTTMVNFDLNKLSYGNAEISGQVVLEDQNTTLEIAVVLARAVNSSSKGPEYCTVTNSTGSYKLQGLANGDYYVMCFAPEVIGEYYENSWDPSTATVVKVSKTEPATNINFSLSSMWLVDDTTFAASSGVKVVGSVTDKEGEKLSDVSVYALTPEGKPVSFARTGTKGTYVISNLPPGDYILQAGSAGYGTEYNDNTDDFSRVKPIKIGNGTVKINFKLSPKSVTSSGNKEDSHIVKEMELYGNYPNPFNPQTRISFAIAKKMDVTLRIYNVAGEIVATLHSGVLSAGRHNVQWNARNNDGSAVSSGVYLYRLEGDGISLTGKMMLIR